MRVVDLGAVEAGIYEVSVEVTRTVRIGAIMKINPSEGYLGIESGNIQVIAISTIQDMNEEPASQAEEFTRVHLDTLEGEDEYMEENIRLNGQLWVVYKYTRSGDTETLPLEEFIAHTMHY
jgi:hypothetical protein